MSEFQDRGDPRRVIDSSRRFERRDGRHFSVAELAAKIEEAMGYAEHMASCQISLHPDLEEKRDGLELTLFKQRLQELVPARQLRICSEILKAQTYSEEACRLTLRLLGAQPIETDREGGTITFEDLQIILVEAGIKISDLKLPQRISIDNEHVLIPAKQSRANPAVQNPDKEQHIGRHKKVMQMLSQKGYEYNVLAGRRSERALGYIGYEVTAPIRKVIFVAEAGKAVFVVHCLDERKTPEAYAQRNREEFKIMQKEGWVGEVTQMRSEADWFERIKVQLDLPPIADSRGLEEVVTNRTFTAALPMEKTRKGLQKEYQATDFSERLSAAISAAMAETRASSELDLMVLRYDSSNALELFYPESVFRHFKAGLPEKKDKKIWLTLTEIVRRIKADEVLGQYQFGREKISEELTNFYEQILARLRSERATEDITVTDFLDTSVGGGIPAVYHPEYYAVFRQLMVEKYGRFRFNPAGLIGQIDAIRVLRTRGCTFADHNFTHYCFVKAREENAALAEECIDQRYRIGFRYHPEIADYIAQNYSRYRSEYYSK